MCDLVLKDSDGKYLKFKEEPGNLIPSTTDDVRLASRIFHEGFAKFLLAAFPKFTAFQYSDEYELMRERDEREKAKARDDCVWWSKRRTLLYTAVMVVAAILVSVGTVMTVLSLIH